MKKDVLYMQNRELSWLKFNKRVLDKAIAENIPLLERWKFLAIYCNNLDEFFMVRVASLVALDIVDPIHIDKKSGLNAKTQLQHIYHEVERLNKKKDVYYHALNSGQTYLQETPYASFDKMDRHYLKHYFFTKISAHVQSYLLDGRHPFPNVASKQICILVRLQRKTKLHYGILLIPKNLQRVIYATSNATSYILLEQLIYEFADVFFEKDIVLERSIFCITRGTDLQEDDESPNNHEAYLKLMKKRVKNRVHMPIVRIEVQNKISQQSKHFLLHQTKIDDEQFFSSSSPLVMSHIFSLLSKLEKKYPSHFYKPFNYPTLRHNVSYLQKCLKEDHFLFYPFENVDLFVELLIEAAYSRQVQSIYITFYRLSNPSRIAETLKIAAQQNKKVVVIMELRARFDELNNIDYSQYLEEAGCEVHYGLENYKVHSKLCVIHLNTPRGKRTITQIGTGNYNEKTSHQYTDYSYITADANIGKDATTILNALRKKDYTVYTNHLLVAPNTLKSVVLKEIDKQIELKEKGYIYMKMNSLTDYDIIKNLIKASQANVTVHLMIRGICCLLPNVKGYSEHIVVRSIIGRFLEHSRIYSFGSTPESNLYISSADMMTRNTQRRIEVAAPILDARIKKQIHTQIKLMWEDSVNGMQLHADGKYRPIKGVEKLDTHQYFIDYYQNYENPLTQHTAWYTRIFGFLKNK